MNETVKSIFQDLGMSLDRQGAAFEQLAAVDSRYLRDLKLNLSAVLKKSKHLQAKEAYLLALSAAVNEKCSPLAEGFIQLAKQEGASAEEIAEVYACVSLMNTNNIFYRFRHVFPDNSHYQNTPAGFRMSIMMNPVLGKEFFELMSLLISAMNNCQLCVTSHEQSVKQHGASEGRIYDTIRLAAIIKSFAVLLPPSFD